MEADIDNLRAAGVWCRESGQIDRAMGLASSLQQLWLTRGRVLEGLAWFDAALAEEAAEGDVLSVARVASARGQDTPAGVSGLDQSFDEADEALTPPAASVTRHCCRALVARGSILGPMRCDRGRTWPRPPTSPANSAIPGGWARSSPGKPPPRSSAAMLSPPLRPRRRGFDLADELGDRFVSRQCRNWIANGRTYLGDLSASADVSTGDRRVISSARRAHAGCRSPGRDPMAGLEGGYQRRHGGREEALNCPPSLGTTTTMACYGQLAITCLAAGDAIAAWEASKAAERDSPWQPMTTGLYIGYAALSALRCGDSTSARRLADESVSMTGGF